jgi:hypothetical protein
MIPLLATVSVHPDGRRPFRLWLPLFLVWLLLLVLLVLLSPVVLIACLICRVNPFKAVAALGGLLAALTGTLVDIQAPGACVLVRVL